MQKRARAVGLALILALANCPAGSALAGAWLRDKGTGFAALSFGATAASETANALYLEYGLSDGTTIGLDISAFTNSLNVRNGFGNLFLRRAIGGTDGPQRMAYEVGLGGLWGNERQLPTVKLALSWGRGLSMGGRSGWINLDAGYVHEPTLGQHITKFDGTFGVNFTEVTTGLVELRLSEQLGETYGAVEPSVLFQPRRSAARIKLGAEIPFDTPEKTALKLGIWHNF